MGFFTAACWHRRQQLVQRALVLQLREDPACWAN